MNPDMVESTIPADQLKNTRQANAQYEAIAREILADELGNAAKRAIFLTSRNGEWYKRLFGRLPGESQRETQFADGSKVLAVYSKLPHNGINGGSVWEIELTVFDAIGSKGEKVNDFLYCLKSSYSFFTLDYVEILILLEMEKETTL